MSEATAKPSTLKILVAEDNPDASRPIRKLIKLDLERRFTGLHFDVLIVTTLKEALEAADDSSATIVDLTLGDAGPEEVIAAIRRFPKPVIVLTGETDPAFHTRCLMNGADYVFVKVAGGPDLAFLQAIIHCLTKDILASTKAAP